MAGTPPQAVLNTSSAGEHNLRGRVVMITGASSGLGRQTALSLAGFGPRMYLVCRDRARAEAVAHDIAAATGNRDVHVLVADLSSQAQVREVAASFVATGDPLHVLLNNAGAVFGFQRRVSEDGVEMTFALNHLAPFTLTTSLLPVLARSAPARIVNVASDAYKDARGPFDFADYNAERRYSPFRQYAHSKLASILFTQRLAAQLDGSGVTANAVSPPRLSRTRFAHNVHPLAKAALRLASPFTLPVDRAAEAIVHLCSSSEVEGVTGTYWSGMTMPELLPAARSVEDAERLWDLSTSLTGAQHSERQRASAAPSAMGDPARLA